MVLLINNIFSGSPRLFQKRRRCWGWIPLAVGHQPTLAADMGAMQQRITTTKGSIISVEAVLVTADNLMDPAPATTFARFGATTVLAGSIAEQATHPAVGPLAFKPRMFDPLGCQQRAP